VNEVSKEAASQNLKCQTKNPVLSQSLSIHFPGPAKVIISLR